MPQQCACCVYVCRISAEYLPYVGRMPAVFLLNISRMSSGCVPYACYVLAAGLLCVRRLSAVLPSLLGAAFLPSSPTLFLQLARLPSLRIFV